MDGAASGVSAGTIAIGNAIWDMAKTAASAVGDFMKSTAQVGMSFDSSMANVAAISGATGDDFDALREKAMEMGSTTVFSASEAADAMGYMAMAGWKTEEMLGGIEGIMNLAAASGEDLATTSDIVTDALTAFGMKAEDSGRFANVLAAASSNANTNVSMMGETFKYVGALAGTMGYSIEDMAVQIGLMANSGIKGSQAGTALRSAITKLTDPTEEAINVMRQLGIMVTETQTTVNGAELDKALSAIEKANGNVEKATLKYNDALTKNGAESSKTQLALLNLEEAQRKAAEAQQKYNEIASGTPETIDLYNSAITDEAGNLKSFSETIDTLRGAFANLTEQEQAQAAASLFGQEAMAGMLAIINAAPEDISKLTEAVANADASEAAKEMAETMTDNVGGAITMMQSAMEGLKITLYDTFSDDLQSGIEGFTTVVEGFTSGFADGGFLGGLQGAGEAIGSLVDSMIQASPELSAISGILSEVFSGIGKEISGFVSNFSGAFSGIGGQISQVFGTVASTVGTMISNISEPLSTIATNVETSFQNVGTTLGTVFGSVSEIVLGLVDTVSEPIGNIVTIVTETFANVSSTLTPMFEDIGNTVSQVVENVKEPLQNIAQNVMTVFEGIVEKLSPIWEAIAEGARNIWEQVKEPLMNLIDDVMALGEKISEVFMAAWDVVSPLFDYIAEIIPVVMESIGAIGQTVIKAFDGVIEFITGIFEGLIQMLHGNAEGAAQAFKDAFDGLTSFFSGLIDDIVDVFSGIGEKFKEIGTNIVSGIKSGIESAWTTVTGTVSSLVKKIIGTAEDGLDEHSPSRVFRQIGEYVMLGFDEGIKAEEDKTARIVKDALKFDTDIITPNKSMLGRVGESMNSTMMLTSGQNQPQTPVKLYIDGREIAAVMYQPLIDEGKRSGVPLYAR